MGCGLSAVDEIARTLADLHRRVDGLERAAGALPSAPLLQVLSTQPAYTARAPVGSVGTALRAWAFQDVLSVNELGQVAVTTPFRNGFAAAVIGSGDASAWAGSGGVYSWDYTDRVRLFLRLADASGAWLSSGVVRVNLIAVGW